METDPTDFDLALSEFRFDDAAALLADLSDTERSAAATRLAVSKDAAADEGERLANRIQKLARTNHYAALLALASDPTSARLLALTSTEIRRGAELHLNGALRRRERGAVTARRDLDRAREALADFDTAEAKTWLDRVDPAMLDDAGRTELGDVRDRLTGLAAEASELSSVAAEVLAEQPVAVDEGARRRLGCLGGSLLILAGVVLGLRAI